MGERPGDRPPYARRVWPPQPEQATGDEALPPSARWYGTPADPHVRRRFPRRLRRLLIILVALVAGAGLIAGAVAVVLRTVTPEPVTARVTDPLAGVSYPLPAGWSEGAMAPVTAFTSVASRGGALVMVRPGPPLGARSPREVTVELSQLYSRLLLHGDTVDVIEDAPVAVGTSEGHAHALRAQYADVVNRPAYLRVVVLSRDDKTVVAVALVQPDDRRGREEAASIVNGIR